MNYLTNFPVNYINSSPNVIVDLTYIASPTLVNEATIGYSAWSENQQFPNGQGELKAVQKSALGITLATVPAGIESARPDSRAQIWRRGFEQAAENRLPGFERQPDFPSTRKRAPME